MLEVINEFTCSHCQYYCQYPTRATEVTVVDSCPACGCVPKLKALLDDIYK